jgi:hypothetical protein
MCRAPSTFITPSSRFWKGEEEGKTKVMQAYKESMARVSCQFFQDSLSKNPSKPFCPFGKDCFYQHLSSDGTEHVFKDGVDVYMKIHSSRQRRAVLEPHIFGAMDFDLNVSRHPLPAGMQFFTFDVENSNDDVETLPDSPDDIPRSRTGRREQPSDARTSDLDATAVALRELERSLDIIIDENSDSGANVELSLLRESLVENIALLLRRNVHNSGNAAGGLTSSREDQAGSLRNSSNDEGRENPDFMQQLQIMTQQFVVSIRDSSRTSRSDSPPPLEAYELYGDDSSREPGSMDSSDSPPPLEAYEPYGDDSSWEPGSMDSNGNSQTSHQSGRRDSDERHSPVHESLDPPFVTDGRGRVVWSAAADRSNEVERPDVQ